MEHPFLLGSLLCSDTCRKYDAAAVSTLLPYSKFGDITCSFYKLWLFLFMQFHLPQVIFEDKGHYPK